MEKRTLEELASAIYQKEQELMDQEDRYYRARRLFEARMDTLSDRRFHLIRLIEQEQEKMTHILTHYEVGRQEAEEFYRACQQLQDEAEWGYREGVQRVELEHEEKQQQLRLECSRLEEELHKLRRVYNDTDD